MFVNDNHFTEWMEHLSGKLNEIGTDLKSLICTDTVFDKAEKQRMIIFPLRYSYL
jgi:hypothetical protein